MRAKVTHPLFQAVRQIVLATYGPPVVVAEEFRTLESVEAVVLFGSWAARYLGHPGRVPNDVDVLVLGNADRDEVADEASPLALELRRLETSRGTST